MKRFILLLTIAGMLIAQDVHLKMNIDEQNVFIGDRIHITYIMSGPEKYFFMMPDVQEWITDIEILDSRTKSQIKKRQNIVSLYLEGVTFDTGFVHIPSMPVVFADSTGFGTRDTLYTPEKYIYIQSILDSSTSAIAMNPPIPLYLMTWWEYLITAVFLVLSIMLLWLGIHHRKSQKPNIEQVWKSPRDKARHAIKTLESQKYPEKKQWKSFYLELTHILREYYEDIHFIHLHELSTSELLPVLKPYVNLECYRKLCLFFQFADLIKFAKGIADAKQCKKDITLVKTIVVEGNRQYNEVELMT